MCVSEYICAVHSTVDMQIWFKETYTHLTTLEFIGIFVKRVRNCACSIVSFFISSDKWMSSIMQTIQIICLFLVACLSCMSDVCLLKSAFYIQFQISEMHSISFHSSSLRSSKVWVYVAKKITNLYWAVSNPWITWNARHSSRNVCRNAIWTQLIYNIFVLFCFVFKR